MIPKIIHQTYKNHELPGVYKACQKTIIELHPEFEYRFYTDEMMDDIIRVEFPDYYAKFNALPRMIMKIDMFRYFLMYKYGGLYADLDYLMFRPFDFLDHDIVIPANRESATGAPECLGNCFFASVPNHPFWKSLIDTLFIIDRSKYDYANDDNIIWHKLGTGPMFVFYMYMRTPHNILVPKRSLFHPPTQLDATYIETLKATDCYGMHICTGFWKNGKL
jgi:mannosyltransferase OCH1-like enzyme